jgi:hypothetical protein
MTGQTFTLECKLSSYSNLLALTILFYRFVDRDMLTRFLGNGIGHKDQVHHSVLSGDEDEEEDEDGPESIEDNGDGANMARSDVSSNGRGRGLGHHDSDDNSDEDSASESDEDDWDDLGFEEI